MGDLGNIKVVPGGVVDATLKDDVIQLNGVDSIMGKVVVIHAGTDDLGNGGDAGSLATGNAGSRLACCKIQEKVNV